ncbi:MAG: hypothetical protein JO146_03345 [Candidatus Eremiobacteraeota bacterium]|nr:hypothetical protein [Candidatus Eremiobacteraeota bacterium]
MMLLPALLLAAAGANPTFPAPATYRYAATLGGQPIGEWSATVQSRSGENEVDENSSAMFAGMQLAATASLVLGADLAPLRYEGSYHTPGQNPSVTVTVSGGYATVSGTLMNGTQRVGLLPNTQHFVVVEPGLLAGLFALPAQLGAWQESAVTWLTPTSAQAQLLTINPKASIPRPRGVPGSDALLSIERPLVVTIWYDPATLVPDEVIVPSQSATLTRERP